MPILLFLIDTSASMNQRSHLGTTYLDTAKGAVETFMKVPTDRAWAATPARQPAGGRGGAEGGGGRRGGGVGDLTAGAAGLGDPLPHRAGGRALRAELGPGPGSGPWRCVEVDLCVWGAVWRGGRCVCGTGGGGRRLLGAPSPSSNLASASLSFVLFLLPSPTRSSAAPCSGSC